MAFDIFPDPTTAAFLGKPPFAPLELAPQERMSAFAPLPSRVGPDPAQANLPTTFLRIAISTASAAVASPALELSAADPVAVPANVRALDPATANTIASAQPLLDAPSITSAALAYFAGAAGNVFLIKIVIEKPDTKLWLRLANANAFACKYVWVVADSEADSSQPWIHLVGPQGAGANAAVVIDAYAGQPLELNAVPLTLRNFGAGATTVAGFSPPLPAPFAIRGVPLTLAPNQLSLHDARLGVEAPTEGPRPPAVFRLVTRDKSDPGPFGALHNDSVTLSANVAKNNIWTPRAGLRVGRAGLAAAPDPSGAAIYAFGGFDANGHMVPMVERYDIGANAWTDVSPMPDIFGGVAVALGRDGWIYAVGYRKPGGEFHTGANVALNPATGEWRTVAPMSRTRTGVALAAGADGLIYAIGGHVDGHPSTGPAAFVGSVEAYDPVNNSWTPREPMRVPRSLLCAASPDGRVIYAAGGISDSGLLPNLEVFDVASASWSPGPPMKITRRDFAFAASRNGKLYAVGGSDDAGGSIGQTEEFDPAGSSWRLRAPLSNARGSLALAGDPTGRLYAIGGNFNNFDVVEALTP